MEIEGNSVTVNIGNLVSDEELSEIFKEEYRAEIRRFLRNGKDLERILTNAVYLSMYRFIDKCCHGKGKEKIRERVYKAIEEVPYYFVFQTSEWHRPENYGYRLLMDVVKESRPQIEQRVNEIIAAYPFHELDQTEIGDVIYNCIMDRLFGKIEGES